MDLVERYVGSVKPFLPWSQREDIAAELTEAIEGKLEDRKAELGRDLTKAEAEAVVREFGHPFMMAGRYGHQRSVIGPALFPIWWLAVRVLVAVTAISHFARSIAYAVMAHGSGEVAEAFSRAWSGFWSTSLFFVGMVTVGLALVEYLKIDPFKNWKVSDLKPPRGMRRPGRIDHGFSLVFSLLGVAWWAALPFAQTLFPDLYLPVTMLERAGVVLASTWFPTVWGLLLVSALGVVFASLTGLIRPDEVGKIAIFRILGHLAAGAAGVVGYTSGALISVVPGSPIALHGAGVAEIDQILRWCFLGTAVMAGVGVAWNLWKIGRSAKA